MHKTTNFIGNFGRKYVVYTQLQAAKELGFSHAGVAFNAFKTLDEQGFIEREKIGGNTYAIFVSECVDFSEIDTSDFSENGTPEFGNNQTEKPPISEPSAPENADDNPENEEDNEKRAFEAWFEQIYRLCPFEDVHFMVKTVATRGNCCNNCVYNDSTSDECSQIPDNIPCGGFAEFHEKLGLIRNIPCKCYDGIMRWFINALKACNEADYGNAITPFKCCKCGGSVKTYSGVHHAHGGYGHWIECENAHKSRAVNQFFCNNMSPFYSNKILLITAWNEANQQFSCADRLYEYDA
jgi:hypothetical protein